MDSASALEGEDEKSRATANTDSTLDSTSASPLYHALPPKPVLNTLLEMESTVESKQYGLLGTSPSDHLSDPGKASNTATILPSEILQHIFSFVDPFSLGRLLSVSRTCNALLDPTKPLPSTTPGCTRLVLKPQDEIWRTSRRRFLPDSPRPMEEMSELDMWKLLHGSACQFCGKKPKDRTPLLATSPWNAGPGPDGVRAIWPFRCRSCGPCLESRMIKETELMLSSNSVLLHGLPCAIFTPSLHYITSLTLRSTAPPSRLQLTKYFFQPQIDELAQKYINVREFGAAATQEWFKGLEALGKSHMKDAARFEQWHSETQALLQLDSGNAGDTSGSTSPARSMASSAVYSRQFNLQSPQRPFTEQNTPMHSGFSAVQQKFSLGNISPMPLQHYGPAPGQVVQADHFITSPFPPQHVGAGSRSFTSGIKPRQERNSDEIDRVKAERRTEIQRRCQELEPPILPSTLAFMDTFTAAIQIARPLTENDWEVLKHRLAAQREEAEKKERETRTATGNSHNQKQGQDASTEEQNKLQDESDRIWNEIQKPSRDKARDYAEEYVKVHWAGGKAVNRMSSGRFAADVLMHVRRQFFETMAKEDTMLKSRAMTIPPHSPIHESRRLKLEDMKYVYEEVIRPGIDRFGREVFLCSTCETNAKRFTFDAVIQHYAAKHTSALSHGNTVVYWKADWPADPPFHPTPDSVWNRPPEHQAVPPPFGSTSPAYTPAWTPYAGAGFMSPLAPGQPNGMYQLQCGELIESAHHNWDATDQIRLLTDNLRLFVVIHQVAKSFSRKFTNEPTLSMFADCVEHKPLLKELKDVGGLTCKACQMYGEPSRDKDVKYLLPDLVHHFQRVHVEHDARSPQTNTAHSVPIPGMPHPKLDWKFDMIDLPSTSAIQSVIRSPGINQEKFELIAEVLPTYFPAPLPQIEPIPFNEEGDLVDRPHVPIMRSPHLVDSVHASFKRPFEEDHQSYPPPIRRAVEYEYYRPQVFQTVRTDSRAERAGGYGPFVTNNPGGGFVYVEKGYRNPEQYYERGPYPYEAGRVRYFPMDSQTSESAVGRNLRGPGSDFVVPSRPHERVPAPLSPEPDSHVQEHDQSSQAAENFLNNFDSIMERPYEDENGGSDRHIGATDRRAGTRTRSPGRTTSQSRQSANPIDVEGSGRPTSRVDTIERQLSRNRSLTPLLDGPARTPHRETLVSQDEDAAIHDHALLSSPPRSFTRGDGSIDRRSQSLRRIEDPDISMRGEGAVPYEYDSYADQGPPARRRIGYAQQAMPHEPYYQEYEERQPMRYIETLPSGQRRYVEELPPSPTFERIDFPVGPKQYVDRGRYYVEQAQPYPSRSGYPYQREITTSIIQPTYVDERTYRAVGYDGGRAGGDIHRSSSPGSRNVKYEEEIYPDTGPIEAHR